MLQQSIMRVSIQYLNPINRKIHNSVTVEFNKNITEAVASSIDHLCRGFNLHMVEVISLYVSVEIL